MRRGRHGGRGSADTGADSIRSRALRIAPAELPLSPVIPRALSKRNGDRPRQDPAPTAPASPFISPCRIHYRWAICCGISFDLLDGNCFPNGNLRPGDWGDGRGALALRVGAEKLKGAARTRSFVRQRVGSHRARARGHGVQVGSPGGYTHDIGVREPQQDPDLRPHDLFVNLESRARTEVASPLLPPQHVDTPLLLHPQPKPWHFAAPGTPGPMPVPQPRARCGAKVLWEWRRAPTHPSAPPPTLTVFFRILAAYGAPVPFSWQLYTTEVAPLRGERREVAWMWPGWRGVPLTPCPPP